MVPGALVEVLSLLVAFAPIVAETLPPPPSQRAEETPSRRAVLTGRLFGDIVVLLCCIRRLGAVGLV